MRNSMEASIHDEVILRNMAVLQREYPRKNIVFYKDYGAIRYTYEVDGKLLNGDELLDYLHSIMKAEAEEREQDRLSALYP